jgi:uncharacterized protein (DUF1697 family)
MSKMLKYIALLRGVNIGGNNKIIMAELKTAFERQGFHDVFTYINSGNVIFKSDIADETALNALCEKRISVDFGLNIAVCVISATDLCETLTHAPVWWNKAPDTRHDAFFVIPPMTAAEVYAHVGEVKSEYEKAYHYGKVIFWSAPMATFSRTRWSKISRDKTMYSAITVRNANTALKLAKLAER